MIFSTPGREARVCRPATSSAICSSVVPSFSLNKTKCSMPILLFVGGELNIELRIFLFRIYFLFHNSNLKILIIHLKAFSCTVALPLVVRMCWPEAGLV